MSDEAAVKDRPAVRTGTQSGQGANPIGTGDHGSDGLQDTAIAVPKQDYVFIVEVADEYNHNIRWPLDERVLRGRWSGMNNAGPKNDDERFRQFNAAPDLPGLRIGVDTRKRVAFIYDPLGEAKYRNVLAKWQSAVQVAFGENCAPERMTELDDMTPDEIKTWCYWVRRFVDAGNVKVMDGTVPSMAAIRGMEGLVQKHNYDNRHDTKKLVEVERRYMPPRPMTKGTTLIEDMDD
jgi:hypothetical protein